MADELAADHALDRRLLEAVDEALVALHRGGAVLRWNAGAEKLYGRPLGVGSDLSLLYPPDDRAMGAHRRELREAEARERSTVECWQARADGSRFYAQVTTTALRDDAGRLLGFARHARDVTERMEYEEALRRSEQRFHGIVDLASEAIVSVDEAQRVVLFNRGAERIFGYSAAEMAGQPLLRLIPEPQRDTHAARVAAFAATGATARPMGARAEVRGVRKNGEEFPAEASISVMLDESGKRVFTAVLRDVSARRAAEREIERLLQAESEARTRAESALRARGDLLGVVAHDFGNALTAVGFHAFELSESLGAHGLDEDHSRAAVILSMVEHMARLQRDLVDSAALEAGHLGMYPAVVDVRRVLEQSAELYNESARSRRVRLHLDLAPGPLPVMADLDRMLQAVGNLVSNAIRHSPAEATVTLSAAAAGTAAVLAVADEGPGIPPGELDHIFEPFWHSGPHSGTGLGLSIARGIVEAQGGTLSAANGGRGAVFSVTLPLASPEASGEPRDDTEPAALPGAHGTSTAPTLAGTPP